MEVFPPTPPLFFPQWPTTPPILVPPVIIPPVDPPCDPEVDPECPEEPPEEPPVDAPEPGLIVLLILGAGLYWLMRPKAKLNAAE